MLISHAYTVIWDRLLILTIINRLFLKLVHMEYQVNHKFQPFWIKRVHLVPNVHTLAGYAIGAIRLAPTTTLHLDTVHKTKYLLASKQPKFKASINNKRNLAQQSDFQEVRS